MGLYAFFRQHRFFVLPLLLFWLLGIAVILLTEQWSLFRWLNQWHSPAADWFFKYFTHLGGRWVFPVGLLFSSFIKYRYLLGILTAGLLTLCLVLVLKKIVFKDTLRPTGWQQFTTEKIHQVPGVENRKRYSFPSGHSIAGFAFWGFWALYSRRSYTKLILWSVAFAVAYSRIYLLHHFLEDVVAGSMLGFGIAVIAYSYSRNGRSSWLDKRVTLKIPTE